MTCYSCVGGFEDVGFVVPTRGEHHPVYGIRPYTSGRNTDTVARIRIRMAVPRIVNSTGRGGIRP